MKFATKDYVSESEIEWQVLMGTKTGEMSSVSRRLGCRE